jgi:hypothetical protein
VIEFCKPRTHRIKTGCRTSLRKQAPGKIVLVKFFARDRPSNANDQGMGLKQIRDYWEKHNNDARQWHLVPEGGEDAVSYIANPDVKLT